MSAMTKIARMALAVFTASTFAGAAFAAPAQADGPAPSASAYFASFETGNSNVVTDNFSQTSVGIVDSTFAEHPGSIYKFQTDSLCRGGFKMTTPGMLFTSTEHPVVTMDVYSPEAASINIKVERTDDSTIKANKLVKLTAGWNADVTVDFSTVAGWDASNSYNELTIFPGYACNQSNGGSASQTYYVDNIQANGFEMPNSNPWIKSVDRQGLWSYVYFALPTLDQGAKYDYVAYRINGGKWVNWGKFAKSGQKLTGIKGWKTYTVQIRAHVAKGAWTGPSNIVYFYAGPAR